MRKKRILFLSCVAVILAVIFCTGYLYQFRGFHNRQLFTGNLDHDRMINAFDPDTDGDGIFNLKDKDANNNGRSNRQDIVTGADHLVGILYDPLKGGYGDLGWKMGFIVCIDVPRIAYAHAGISLDQLLKEDYDRHPAHYHTQGGMNTPATPFFYRRVRNVYDYAKTNGLLIRKTVKPRTGDIVFYSRYHATLVVGTHADGTYDEVEANPEQIVVRKHLHKKWKPRDVARLLD
ncbi:MAG: DUF1287 domain-containing protein [Sporolactobacillus sp.]